MKNLSPIIAIIFSGMLFLASCSKENQPSNQLTGLWECDSTVLGDQHSMWFKAKKYDFKESGEFDRDYGVFGLKDFGTWQYDENSQLLYLTVDTLYDHSDKIEAMEIELISRQNLILVEDYDSLFYNGSWEFIREYYTKKQ